MKKVLIIGGAYAGLAAACKLAQEKAFLISVLDQGSSFLDSIALHESVRLPLARLQLPYQNIQKQAIAFIQEKALLDEANIVEWSKKKCLELAKGRTIPFDYLILATGSPENQACAGLLKKAPQEQIVDLAKIKMRGARFYLEKCLAYKKEHGQDAKDFAVHIVGGGATSIQFLFEIAEWLRKKAPARPPALIHSGDKLLKKFPYPFHDYCKQKIQRLGIQYYPGLRLRGYEGSQLVCEDGNRKKLRFTSELCFFFPGNMPARWEANPYGQFLWQQKSFQKIYLAGDCCVYPQGLNNQSAQAALRQGLLAADNIIAHANGRKLRRYLYPELGSFVSLGPGDAIAWLFFEFNILRGASAFLVKEAIRKQFRLLLAGINTYIAL